MLLLVSIHPQSSWAYAGGLEVPAPAKPSLGQEDSSRNHFSFKALTREGERIQRLEFVVKFAIRDGPEDDTDGKQRS